MPALSPSSSSSAQALHKLGNHARKTMADAIVEVVLVLQRQGQKDASRREIQNCFEVLSGKRIEASTVSARVNELICANRLEVVSVKRPCRINPICEISPVRVPAQQVRLVA